MSSASRGVVWFLCLSMIVGPLGCAKQERIQPPHSKAEVLEAELKLATEIELSKELQQGQVDHRLRIASMALDAGRPELMRETLIGVTSWMAANEPEKDFTKRAEKSVRVLGGKEQDKYFLGDPYEQLLAYLYLGILDFQAEDYQNAVSSFRSASFADEGSKEEGYKSDCYLAFILEGVASRIAGDEEGAQVAFGMAQRAFSFRQEMRVMEQALNRGGASYRSLDASKKEQAKFEALFDLVFAQLPISASIATGSREIIESAFAGANAALNTDTKSLDKPEKKAYKESPEAAVVKAYGKKGLGQAREDLNRLKGCVHDSVSPEQSEALAGANQQFAAVMARCLDPNTNAFFLQQVGIGPAKIRQGRYGEAVKLRPYAHPAERMFATLTPTDSSASSDPQLILALLGESVDYQALTRGGRYMDRILRGKAKFQHGMNITADVAKGVAVASAVGAGAMSMSSSSDSGEAMVVLLIVLGVALAVREISYAISDATHPEGDIRGWHELPSRIFFSCAALEPGEYEMQSEFMDAFANPLPSETKRSRFVVEPGRTSLFLLGSPWNQ